MYVTRAYMHSNTPLQLAAYRQEGGKLCMQYKILFFKKFSRAIVETTL